MVGVQFRNEFQYRGTGFISPDSCVAGEVSPPLAASEKSVRAMLTAN
jgi:hypothetical protein